MSFDLAQPPESGSHLGRTSPFGDVSEHSSSPVDSARHLWLNGYSVIPFRIWNDGKKTHKVPMVKTWKPYRLKLNECEKLVTRSSAFGIVVPAGLIVIDLDSVASASAERAKFAGLHNLLDMSERHMDNLDFMNTLTVNTPSGGAHLWYRVPLGFTTSNSASQLAASIDIRVAEKGLILMPPSMAPGGSYEFDLTMGTPDVARAPWWLLNDLRKEKETQLDRSRKERKEYALDGSSAAIEKYLGKKSLQIQSAGTGMRNNVLNACAYGIYKRVAEGKVPLAAAEDVIYNSALSTGLDGREIEATMRSARRAANA